MKILLVEDHVDTAQMLARFLHGAGHEVETAGSVGEAATACGAMAFDLLLCDIGLPDGTGLELMRQLRQRCAIPGIALSGYGMEEDQRDCLEAGFAAHMTKPIDFGKLQEAIRQVSK